MPWQMIITGVTLAACLGASQTVGGKSDEDLIQGVWQAVGGEKKGKDLTKDFVKENAFQLEFKGSSLTFRKDKEERPGTFKLDSTKNPKHIDFSEGKDGIIRKGIYELTGDDLKVCVVDDVPSEVRPTDFKTKEGSSMHVVILKRVKK